MRSFHPAGPKLRRSSRRRAAGRAPKGERRPPTSFRGFAAEGFLAPASAAGDAGAVQRPEDSGFSRSLPARPCGPVVSVGYWQSLGLRL